MTEHEEVRTISVSRDALRADLAEMELRMRTYFDQKIGEKAASSELDALAKRVDLHEAGVFPPAWEMRVSSIIDNAMNNRLRNTWALRGNKGAWIVGICGIFGVFVSVGSLYISLRH